MSRQTTVNTDELPLSPASRSSQRREDHSRPRAARRQLLHLVSEMLPHPRHGKPNQPFLQFGGKKNDKLDSRPGRHLYLRDLPNPTLLSALNSLTPNHVCG